MRTFFCLLFTDNMSHGLDEEQVVEFQEVFNKFDEAKEGKVATSHLEDLFQ